MCSLTCKTKDDPFQRINDIEFSNPWLVAQKSQAERQTALDAIWVSAFTLRARSPRHMGEP
jgi:hypothetical protein